jgi:hypothetical protein
MTNRCVSVFIVALAIGPLWGQIQYLATTGDGSVLYFDTALPRQGTREPSQSRIYKIGAAGLSLFASVPEVDTPTPPRGTLCPNAFSLSQPDVSRDGTVIAYGGTGGTGTCFTQ